MTHNVRIKSKGKYDYLDCSLCVWINMLRERNREMYARAKEVTTKRGYALARHSEESSLFRKE